MKTSEIRKIAFKVAYEAYENASGELKHAFIDLEPICNKLGLDDIKIIESVCSYLNSVGVMEYPYIGSNFVMSFTMSGISIIESSIDEPTVSHGPFPALSLVIGDIGAGAQIAIGSTNVTQKQNSENNDAEILSLVPKILVAISELQAAGRTSDVELLKMVHSEISNKSNDSGFVRKLLDRFVLSAAGQAGSSAVSTLVAAIKSISWG